MKVLDLTPLDFGQTAINEILLPHGIIGFSAYKRAELLYLPDNLPFLWLRLCGPENLDPVHFVVMEPGSFVPGYEPEIFDEDAEQLGIESAADAMLLNIVTLRNNQPADASINLVGPLIVNRRTRTGRQLVISNYARYSAHHPLIDHSREPAFAQTA